MPINFFSKNIFLLIIQTILIKISNSEKQSLIFPFKTYQPYQYKEYTYLVHEQVYDSLENFYLYSIYEVGNPPKEIPIFYNFKNSSFTFKTDLKFIIPNKTNYYPSNSNSFKKLENNFQDEFKIKTKNKKITNKFSFLYQKNNEKEGNITGWLGLQNIYKDKDIKNTNFLYQLKELGLIDYISFSINYISENEGSININMEPNEYSSKYYSDKKKYTTSIRDVKSNYTNDLGEYLWSIDIKSVCYKNFENKTIFINEENNEIKNDKYSAILIPQYGLIKGPNSYKNLIEKDFFKKLIDNDICAALKIEKKLYYICKADNKTLIKNTFPTLYFYHKEFNYTYELNFYDLFYEKFEILYFLICFETQPNNDDKYEQASEWILGRPFLYKYQFSFDIEQKKISFYDNLKGYITNKKMLLKENNSLIIKFITSPNVLSISILIMIGSYYFISFYYKYECYDVEMIEEEEKEKIKVKKFHEQEEQESLNSFNQKEEKNN